MVDAEKCGSDETSEESEGALMAKPETKAERRAREDEHRKTVQLAKGVASIIHGKREGISASPHRKELNAWIGQVLCEFPIRDVPRFLRLVADMLEGKQPHSPANHCGYDSEIAAAYKEACLLTRRVFLDSEPARSLSSDVANAPFLDPKGGYFLTSGEAIIPLPSGPPGAIIRLIPPFWLFLDIFREQNPKLHGASDGSLRRSLRRLGLQTTASKRGRPKGKEKARAPYIVEVTNIKRLMGDPISTADVPKEKK
jgi:hypothetical protein